MTRLPTPRELETINLQYDAGAAALNVRAVSQLLAKLLYAAGRLVSKAPRDLEREAARLLEMRKISHELIESGLGFLESLGFARQLGGRWLLTERGYDAIAADVKRADERLDGVLSRHFPSRVQRDLLKEWFQDACVQFYGLYGAQWAAALGRKASPKGMTREVVLSLLDSTLARHGLQGEAGALVAGFHSFLSSPEPEDVEHNWSLCQALLASRLVAANIGPDPVTAEEFCGTLLLLDTNALIVTALEAHRLAHPLRELGRVLRQLGASLGYIEETREEYTRVIAGKRADVCRAISHYTTAVLRETRDPFIDSALEQIRVGSSDVDLYFDQLLDPPRVLDDDVPVEVVNDPDVVELGKKGAEDEALRSEITAVWNQYRKKKKSQRAAEHDAALTTVAEGLRAKDRKCAVLTLDRTMHEHSLKRAGSSGLPQWVSLDAVIQILALDNGGPHHGASDFAPLMATIIRHQCEPMLKTYTAEDLSMMLDVEEQCAELPQDQVQAIATAVARERLKGRTRNDPELALVVRRGFQAGKFKLADDVTQLADELHETKAAVRARDAQLVNARAQNEAGVEGYVCVRSAAIKKAADLRATLKSGAGLIGMVLAGYILFRFVTHMVPHFGPEWVELCTSLLFPITGMAAWLTTKVLPQWKYERATASQVALSEIRDRMNTKTEQEVR